MAMCCSNASTVEEDKTNRDISKQIRDDRKKKDAEVRLLLLGAGESGKSTVAKQMKILHMGGFTKEERQTYVNYIHANLYETIKILIEASEALEIPITSNKSFLESMSAPYSSPFTMDDMKKIESFWSDPNVKKVYERRNEYHIGDSTEYWMGNLKRILAPDYLPIDQDILRLRIQTTGIIEITFTVNDVKFVIVDVGGQRSERKKWIHCFEGVAGVLFCVGMSEFDQVLHEDNRTNRMKEALKLFHEICQSKWFSNTAIILFLNKEDLFKSKLEQGKSIKAAFPEYTGPDTYKESLEYIQEKFTNIKDPSTGHKKEVFTHITTATNTDNIAVVFNAVQSFIASSALYAVGLI